MSLADANRMTRLQWFARQVLDESWNGSPDGADLQELGLKAGLLTEGIVTEENREWVDEEIANAECLELGDTFYTYSKDLTEVDWGQIEPRGLSAAVALDSAAASTSSREPLRPQDEEVT